MRVVALSIISHYMCGSRGGQEVQSPLKITKNIGFLINTGPDPPKNHEAAKPAFNVGPPWKHHLNNLLTLLTRHCHFF